MGDFLFGGKSEPTVTTSTQTSTLPDELKEPTKEILGQAKTIYEEQKEQGYQPYTGPRLAEFDPATQQALQISQNLSSQGLASIPGLAQAQTYYAPALTYAMKAGQKWTPETAQQYMSPYIQSVIDIEKREAERQGDLQQQNIAGSATQGAGSFGGSRQAILEAEQMRNEARLMGDIQQRGMQTAYEQGLGAFQQQKGREAALAPTLATMGSQAYGQASSEMQNLANVGQVRQDQAQRALDIDYQKYLQEKEFPTTSLQQYADFVRGVSRPPDVSTIQAGQTPVPTLAAQLTGLGLAGAGLYKAFSKSGGRMGDAKKGLATVYRAYGSSVSPYTQRGADLRSGYERDKAEAAARAAKRSKDVESDKWLTLSELGLRLMSDAGPGGFVGGLGRSGISSLQAFKDIKARESEIEDKKRAEEREAERSIYGLDVAEDQRKFEIESKAADREFEKLKHLDDVGFKKRAANVADQRVALEKERLNLDKMDSAAQNEFKRKDLQLRGVEMALQDDARNRGLDLEAERNQISRDELAEKIRQFNEMLPIEQKEADAKLSAAASKGGMKAADVARIDSDIKTAFAEGLTTTDANGNTITTYQFQDRGKALEAKEAAILAFGATEGTYDEKMAAAVRVVEEFRSGNKKETPTTPPASGGAPVVTPTNNRSALTPKN